MKTFITALSVGISFFLLSSSANAEYYMVANGCGGCSPCARPCAVVSCVRQYYYPCYQRLYFVSPRRTHHTGSGEMEPYAWIPTP